MGTADIDRSEVAAARARMTDIAVELAHRAEPDHLKEIAREKAEDLKGMALDKAEDLKVMAKDKAHEQLADMKDAAKEKAMQKTYEMKDRFVESRSRPYVGALLGGSVGWFLFQKLFGKRKAEHSTTVGISPISPYTERSYVGSTGLYDAGYVGTSDPGYAATGGYSEDFYGVDQPAPAGIAVEGSDQTFGLNDNADAGGVDVKGRIAGAASNAKEHVAGVASNAKERVAGAASNAKERVADVASNAKGKVASVASNVREHVPSPSQVKEKGAAWYHQGVSEQPLLFAVGALALGMIASWLIPVSARERQLVAPAKQKVMEPAMAKAQQALDNFSHMAEEKLAPAKPEQNNDETAMVAVATTEGDPLMKDEFGMGIPDPQSFPSR